MSNIETYLLLVVCAWGSILFSALFELIELLFNPFAAEVSHNWAWRYFHRRCQQRHCETCDVRWKP